MGILAGKSQSAEDLPLWATAMSGSCFGGPDVTSADEMGGHMKRHQEVTAVAQ